MSEDLLDRLLSSVENDLNICLNNTSPESNPNNTSQDNNKSSVVHTGDTDSSDNEENRNFENNKLSDYGKSIKSLFSTPAPASTKEPTKTWLSKSVVASKSVTSSEQSKTVFGVHIINPLVPSNIIEERLRNREVVVFNRIKFFIRNISADKDWVVAGVIVQKTVKTSQNGKKYCMWTLSDLKAELKSVVVFLFGSAYKELWKTTVGMVVGILNPSVFDGKDGSKDEARLSVDNHQKIMILGKSRDYGICKSIKRNGDHCTAFVNKTICEFCLYHIKQEYQQFSKRSDIQSGFPNGTRDLTALRNKVLGKDQVFYAGKLYTAVKNPKAVARDKQRLMSLNGSLQNNKMVKKVKPQQAASLDITVNQRMRDLQLLKQLGIHSPSSERVDFNPEVSQEVTVEDSRNLAIKLKSVYETRQLQNIVDKTKTLTPDSNTMIDLSIDFKNIAKSTSEIPKLSKQAISAKQNAIKWVQVNGSIKRGDPNNVRVSENQKKRILEDIEPVSNPKMTKIQENSFFSERFKKMMAATSSHMDLVENYTNEQEEKHFNKLEMKERLEEKMLTTYKMQCKAVRCLKCKYTNFSASDLCKSERHPLKVFDAIKRFFKCGNCGNRIVCLEVVPTTACTNCSSSKWERTGMMKERKIEIGAPKLSIRGGEQKFLNSAITDASLNLMVPDD